MGAAIGGTTSLKDLTINSTTTGAGDITLANIGSSTVGVAGNTLIGNTSTGTINLNGTIYKTTGSQTYQASATGDDTGDNINIASAATFTTTDTNVLFETSDVELADDAHLTITTGAGTVGNITFEGSIHGTSGGNTTNIAGLTSGTGTVTVKAIDTNIEDITITGPTKLQGNITTANNGVISITGNTTVDAATLAIDTATGGGANVTISGTLDSLQSGRNLDINSGSGVTEITGAIGNTLAFTTVDINAVAAAGNTGGVTLGGNIGGGSAGSGITNIGNTGTTGAITLSGTTYFTSGALAFDGASYSISNASDVTIKTSSQTVDFGTGDVTIGNMGFTVDTDPGDTGSAGADITFAGNILGTTTGSGASDVTLDADTADVTVLGIGCLLYTSDAADDP